MWLATMLGIGLGTQPSTAADAVRADVIVHVTRVQPTHQLVETSRVELAYGTSAGAIGFEPAGAERVAVGPTAFDVDAQGNYIVADPVHRRLVRVALGSGKARTSPIRPLPVPFSDLAVDRQGWIYVTDLRSHTVTTLGPSTTSKTTLPGKSPTLGFVRNGDDVVVSAGPWQRRLQRGILTDFASAVGVEQCNAEAGLITMAATGKQIQVEIGGPLASIRLLGVTTAGDIFIIIERFRQRGRLAVDRHLVVLDSTGALRARQQLQDQPVLHPVREFVLSPSGALHQMIPGPSGVTFVSWEVRP